MIKHNIYSFYLKLLTFNFILFINNTKKKEREIIKILILIKKRNVPFICSALQAFLTFSHSISSKLFHLADVVEYTSARVIFDPFGLRFIRSSEIIFD
jgi:hypothetical protein